MALVITLEPMGLITLAKRSWRPAPAEIDRLPTLERYETVLHLLGKKAIVRGRSTWQNADLAVGLRNELVHYKSKWSSQLERAKWLKLLGLSSISRLHLSQQKVASSLISVLAQTAHAGVSSRWRTSWRRSTKASALIRR